MRAGGGRNEGRVRVVGGGVLTLRGQRTQTKDRKTGKPRYFSIFTFCSGPSKSTSASPSSPEINWREISTGRKSEQ